MGFQISSITGAFGHVMLTDKVSLSKSTDDSMIEYEIKSDVTQWGNGTWGLSVVVEQG